MQYANSRFPRLRSAARPSKVELVYADNETKADKAVSAASNLVAQGVSIVLGTYGSRQAIAASETFKEAGIPQWGVTCTNPLRSPEGNSHYFRICFTDPFQGPVLQALLKDEFNADKVYCLSENGDDYGAGLCQLLQGEGNELGIEVIEDVFPSQNADFTSYMNNAKKEGVKAILLRFHFLRTAYHRPGNRTGASTSPSSVPIHGIPTPSLRLQRARISTSMFPPSIRRCKPRI